jgi:hypothetical protein
MMKVVRMMMMRMMMRTMSDYPLVTASRVVLFVCIMCFLMSNTTDVSVYHMNPVLMGLGDG